MDHQARAIEASRKHHKDKKLKDVKVVQAFPRFHNGSLYVVGWVGPDGKPYEDNVLLTNGVAQVFINDGELVEHVGRTSQPDNLVTRLFQISGVSGVIAVIITVTICYLAITKQEPNSVPDVLSNALTAILGFYFASAIYEARKNGE